MDYSLQGSSVHGIFQARVQEWGAIAFSGVGGAGGGGLKSTFSAESTKSVTPKDKGTERKTQELLCPIEKPQQATRGF